MNYELIDNFGQVLLLSSTSIVALFRSLRYMERKLLLLSLGYMCFSMGTLYFLLHLALRGNAPQVFYVSESLWIAAYFFFLSIQLLRTEKMFRHPILRHRICVSILCVVFTSFLVLWGYMMGPSQFVSGVLAIVLGITVYLSVLHLWETRQVFDICLLLCIVLQLSLYISSWFIQDYTQFSLYFAIDLVLTLSLMALLPCLMKEVHRP